MHYCVVTGRALFNMGKIGKMISCDLPAPIADLYSFEVLLLKEKAKMQTIHLFAVHGLLHHPFYDSCESAHNYAMND